MGRIRVLNLQELLEYCLDERAADPTQRLCAYDEWHPILLSWMEECTEVDRYLRLHTILSRCIHDT